MPSWDAWCETCSISSDWVKKWMWEKERGRESVCVCVWARKRRERKRETSYFNLKRNPNETFDVWKIFSIEFPFFVFLLFFSIWMRIEKSGFKMSLNVRPFLPSKQTIRRTFVEWNDPPFLHKWSFAGGTAWHRGSVRASHPAVPGSNLLTAGRKSRTHLSLRTCSANFVR